MTPRSERTTRQTGTRPRKTAGKPGVLMPRAAGRILGGLLAVAVPMLLVACTSSTGPARPHQPVAAASVPKGPSAAQLAAGRWVRTAAPPIPVCETAAGVWDGSALVIIESGPAPCRTGAEAYDPATNRWARLPAPPSPVGRYPLAAWGGGKLVLVSPRTGSAAAWSPSARRWARLPRVPATTVISLTWTGTTFLAITSRQAYQATGRAWRLAGRRWRSLPSLPPVWHGWYASAPAAAVGRSVYVLAHEFHGKLSKHNISGSSRLLRRTAAGWTVLPLPRPAAQGWALILSPLDGRLLATGTSCSAMECMEEVGEASLITPGAGRSGPHATALSPPGGIGLPFPQGIAAGPKAIVVTYSVGGNTLMGSGADSRDVRLYDPLTGRWLTGPRAPATYPSPAFWTPDGVALLGQGGGWMLRPSGQRHVTSG